MRPHPQTPCSEPPCVTCAARFPWHVSHLPDFHGVSRTCRAHRRRQPAAAPRIFATERALASLAFDTLSSTSQPILGAAAQDVSALFSSHPRTSVAASELNSDGRWGCPGHTVDGSDDGSGSFAAAGVKDSPLGRQLRSYGQLQFGVCAFSAVMAVLFFRSRPATDKKEMTMQVPRRPPASTRLSVCPPAPALPRLLLLLPTSTVAHPQLLCAAPLAHRALVSQRGAGVAGSEEPGLVESLKICFSNPHFILLSLVFGSVRRPLPPPHDGHHSHVL